VYRAKPQPYIPYDHARRAQRGAEFETAKKLMENQHVRKTINQKFLSARPDRLRLMGEK